MNTNDKTEIIQVINLYALVLDSQSWDLMDQVFTEDATADFGPAGALWKNLEEFTYGFKVFHESLDNHMHSMFGSVVEVDGDTAHAFTYGDWLLVRDAAAEEGDGNSWTGRGWYDDELVRTEKGWRIKKRVCRLVNWSGNPAVSQPAPGQTPTNDTFVLKEYKEEGKSRLLKMFADKIDK